MAGWPAPRPSWPTSSSSADLSREPNGFARTVSRSATSFARVRQRANGEVIMASNDTPRPISDMRGVRYGEVLAVFLRDGGFEAEVYGTQMLNDCPQELWETLDPAAIAAEMGAVVVKLNGPRHWMLDGLGQKVAVVEPLMRDFNGLTMRRIAVVD